MRLLTIKNDTFSAGLQKLNLHHKNKPRLPQRYMAYTARTPPFCTSKLLMRIMPSSKPRSYEVYQKHATCHNKKWVRGSDANPSTFWVMWCAVFSSKAVSSPRKKIGQYEVREYYSQWSGLPYEARKFKLHTRDESSRVEH